MHDLCLPSHTVAGITLPTTTTHYYYYPLPTDIGPYSIYLHFSECFTSDLSGILFSTLSFFGIHDHWPSLVVIVIGTINIGHHWHLYHWTSLHSSTWDIKPPWLCHRASDIIGLIYALPLSIRHHRTSLCTTHYPSDIIIGATSLDIIIGVILFIWSYLIHWTSPLESLEWSTHWYHHWTQLDDTHLGIGWLNTGRFKCFSGRNSRDTYRGYM